MNPCHPQVREVGPDSIRRRFFPIAPRALLGVWLLFAGAAGAATRYVDLNNLTPAAPYTDWATAATNIQDAVDIAVEGEEILVTNGVYQTGAREVDGMSNRVAVTKAVKVRSVNGPAVTQIVGSQVPGTRNGPAAVRCVYLANGAALVGFTLTNGATQFSPSPHIPEIDSGGGVLCAGLSAVVSNCVLTGNSASHNGGGAWWGTLNNCTLTGNIADDYGGGTVHGTLNNCLLTSNSASLGGGGAADGTLANCTLTGNSASFGSGAYQSRLKNCIVYYNSAPYGDANYDYSTLNYCCTTPPLAGTGNLTNAPSFVDTNGWSNLRLQTNSPCINAGNNADAPGDTDLDGNPRIAGGTVDIGAYEFQGDGLSGFPAWLWQYGLPTDGSADATDPDQDRMNNGQEWVAGTNPTNAASALRILPVTGPVTDVSVSWTSVTNRSYALERATNLGAVPGFSLVQSNLAGLPGATSYTDTNAVGSAPRFYRVRVEP
jgi:parallel beta-helix repeat protein